MILFKDVTLSFGQQEILSDFNLKINAGEFIALTGKSGKGKSTILRLIAGLQPYDSGSISNSFEQCGFIFQDYNLFPHLTVKQNLMIPFKGKSIKNYDLEQLTESLLSRFEIHHLISKYPDQLSGGEKQRVAIARAMMLDPDILLVDEATSALDNERAHYFMNTLCDLNDQGVTIVFVSHQEELVRNYAKRIINI